MILSRCRQRLGSYVTAKRGLLVHMLPLDLYSPPCWDIGCPLPVTKEVWLLCLLSLELNWLMTVLFSIFHLPSLVRMSRTGISSSQAQASSSPIRLLAHPVTFTSTQRSTPWDPCLPTQAEGIREPCEDLLTGLYHIEDALVPYRGWPERTLHWEISHNFSSSWVFHLRFLSSYP